MPKKVQPTVLRGLKDTGAQSVVKLNLPGSIVNHKPVQPIDCSLGGHVHDSKTIKIPGSTYDGRGGQVFFTAGEGPQPSSKGFIVPDVLGCLTPLERYEDQYAVLQLPGAQSIFNIDWLAVYNRETKQSIGQVIVPEGLNVPLSLVSVMLYDPGFPNCKMIHKNLMVTWESFPPQLTIQVSGDVYAVDEDTSEEAFAKCAQEQLTSGISGLVIDSDMDKIEEERMMTTFTLTHWIYGLRRVQWRILHFLQEKFGEIVASSILFEGEVKKKLQCLPQVKENGTIVASPS